MHHITINTAIAVDKIFKLRKRDRHNLFLTNQK